MGIAGMAELDVVDEGTGVPVVLSHGGSSDRRYWEPQRASFSARHRVVTYSQRLAPPADGGVDGTAAAPDHVADILAIIDGLAAGPVHLVGFSSAVGLRTVLAAPARIRSLTIVEPNVPWLLQGDSDGEAALAWWRAENERVRAGAAGDDDRAARLWFELVNNRGPGTFEAQPEAFRRMWLERFAGNRSAAAAAVPLRCVDLGRIRVPTLALGGEHGMPYSRAILDRVASCIPGGDRVIVPGVTHFMSYQAPERFNDIVLDFIDRH
ncbi:MAG TPA: alpha/beta hydrolase [Candidatus Limnocylindrales bacterium]|nr:alpha/beta hydrolase [Candidatus Limnocylindrales bacterium]